MLCCSVHMQVTSCAWVQVAAAADKCKQACQGWHVVQYSTRSGMLA
jgi:hypothetical protein